MTAQKERKVWTPKKQPSAQELIDEVSEEETPAISEEDVKELLLNCLESIFQSKGKLDLWQVIVVDNASSDGSVEVVKSKYPQVELVENKTNLGFAAGNNVGIKYALENDADYIGILNNDTLVDENFIEELINVLEKDGNIGVAVPKIYFAKGFEFHKNKYKENELGRVIWYAGGEIDWKNVIGSHSGLDEVDKGQFDEDGETQMATGCCFLVKKEVLEKVGLYDDRYFLYFEDADFSERVKKAGYKIMYEPKAIIWHKNAQSTGAGSNLQTYFQTRNRLLFGLSYAPIRTKLALFRESLRLILVGRYWQKRGIMDFYLGRFGRGSFPL